ncbi:uncharacterized protein LOC119562316 [Drosophila subpulchrella]|uniref:uncharacterized protein LOC119562316 n=1 Tax=Drosophila subpulchrella TaxID=1486046 RepID=UPI0018A19F06|nr:uncharacterized protein LOC119562316 [Drosophila subpulchrella]XP_037731411.1 uncharacterized protein LOC119562316 [Drosophila subpulchrella]XP_037731417.1 uncharacterized protein LOC119562316 [Drosophila subpulchrella]XP_037731427.1 uncharacterized protein LOC119562316 [Drosophila subpulchrella]
MAYPYRNLGDILDGVKEDPKHLRNLSNIYKLELEMQKREYGKKEDVSHSRIQLREGPDILAAYKKDAVTLRYFNKLAPWTFYDVPFDKQTETNISDLSAYLVIPENPDSKPKSTYKM